MTDCQTVEEEVCFPVADSEEKVCKNYPKQECKLVEQTRKEFVPEVKCRKLETQVCGPEKCPLTKGEPVCYDEMKQVSKHDCWLCAQLLWAKSP